MIPWLIEPGGTHPATGYTILAGFLLALLLLRAARQERRTVATVAGLLFACLAALWVAGSLGPEGAAAASWVRGIAIFAAGACLLSLLGIAVFRVLLPAVGVHSPRILQDVLVAVSALAWLLIWLSVNRVNVTGLVATSAVLTAVLGLSLQDTLGNVLGGMAIQLDRSIQVGDWIRFDGAEGKVVEIRWRYTAIETRDWETVIIPNGVLLKNRLTVLGRRQGHPARLRRTLQFNVDFRYPPAQVIETVENTVRSARIPRVAEEPPPHCLLMDFNESDGRYGLRYWLDDLTQDEPVDSEVRAHIYYALKREGIPLSIPAYALFLTEDTSERRAGKAERELARRVEALRAVEVFADLRPEERERLAGRLVPAPFPPGGIVTRQGAEADCLYLLVQGHADVMVANGQGQAARVAELGPGSVVGEMGLMTGEPRSATVVARTGLECLRLDREAFREVLKARPSLAMDISMLLARRRAELDAALHDLDTEGRQRHLARSGHDLLGRIRSFFGLEDAG